MENTKYKKQHKIIIIIIIIIITINNKIKVLVGAYPSRKKKVGLYKTYHELLSKKWIVKGSWFHASYIISPQSVAIFEHPILSVVFSISTIVLRTRLIRVQSQNPIKQVGLTIHSKISLVRNSGNMKYKTPKPCNENQILKPTDLRQTYRFIESWSISTALASCSLRFSQVH